MYAYLEIFHQLTRKMHCSSSSLSKSLRAYRLGGTLFRALIKNKGMQLGLMKLVGTNFSNLVVA